MHAGVGRVPQAPQENGEGGEPKVGLRFSAACGEPNELYRVPVPNCTINSGLHCHEKKGNLKGTPLTPPPGLTRVWIGCRLTKLETLGGGVERDGARFAAGPQLL